MISVITLARSTGSRGSWASPGAAVTSNASADGS